jgi:hypothetical protein
LGDGNTHISTDEEFEETSKMVLEAYRKVEDNKKIRKRKK